jgi:hypothetical protein
MEKMNIAISVEKLASLIKAGHLCAADLQCLDKQTKQQLWQLCLWCCDKRIHCTKGACSSQCGAPQSCGNTSKILSHADMRAAIRDDVRTEMNARDSSQQVQTQKV